MIMQSTSIYTHIPPSSARTPYTNSTQISTSPCCDTLVLTLPLSLSLIYSSLKVSSNFETHEFADLQLGCC